MSLSSTESWLLLLLSDAAARGILWFAAAILPAEGRDSISSAPSRIDKGDPERRNVFVGVGVEHIDPTEETDLRTAELQPAEAIRFGTACR